MTQFKGETNQNIVQGVIQTLVILQESNLEFFLLLKYTCCGSPVYLRIWLLNSIIGRICFIDQRSNTYIGSIHFELADSHTDVSGCKNYTEIMCIILSSFSLGLFPMITFSPLSIQLGFFYWLACLHISPQPFAASLPFAWCNQLEFQMLWFMNYVQN